MTWYPSVGIYLCLHTDAIACMIFYRVIGDYKKKKYTEYKRSVNEQKIVIRTINGGGLK